MLHLLKTVPTPFHYSVAYDWLWLLPLPFPSVTFKAALQQTHSLIQEQPYKTQEQGWTKAPEKQLKS